MRFSAKTMLACSLVVLMAFCPVAAASIFQYFDGDGDGSLFLTELDAEPSAYLAGQTLYWADLVGVDLSNAYLSGTNLFAADLTEANLAGSYMMSANLTQAIMPGANLTFSYLYGAQVTEANLSSVDLSYAYLAFADISGANLTDADLSFANLINADFSGAQLSGADLSQVCLGFNTNFEGATYSVDTTFAYGMDPDVLGMIYVPAPGTLAILGLINMIGFRLRRRIQ